MKRIFKAINHQITQVNIKSDRAVQFIMASTAFTIILMFISTYGIGNGFFSYMVSPAGRFDDFFNIFAYAPRVPDPEISFQLTGLAILFGRIFNESQTFGLIIALVLGLALPLFLIQRSISSHFKQKPFLYICFILFSYPVIFGFCRGNPTLAAALWSIVSVFSFMSGRMRLSQIALVIASCIHPSAVFFSALFLSNGRSGFFVLMRLGFIILILQILFYYLLEGNAFSTIRNVFLSLEQYNQDYILGTGGDLYNNSLFLVIKTMFYNNPFVIETALIYLAPLVFIIGLIKASMHYVKYKWSSTVIYFVCFLMPIIMILSSPVSADYRLSYLLIPALLMLLVKDLSIILICILVVMLPKHFIFFSSYWLNLYPDSIFVYDNLIETIGQTINSFINPLLLLIILLSKHNRLSIWISNFDKKFVNK